MRSGLRRPAGFVMLAVVVAGLLFGVMTLTVFSAQGQPEGAVGLDTAGSATAWQWLPASAFGSEDLQSSPAQPAAADFQFDKKVKLSSDYVVDGCNMATAFDSLTVPYSTSVAYCYYFTNIGTTTWITISLTDDKLGNILPTAVNVPPKGQIGLAARPPALAESVTNTATWTATDTEGTTLARVDSVAVTVVTDLEGYVFIDTDGDGVRDPEETTGLAGVRVKLESQPVNPALSRETTTDAAGHYAFADAVVGGYTVSIQLPLGYMPTSPLRVPVSGEPNVINFGVREATATVYLPLTVRTAP